MDKDRYIFVKALAENDYTQPDGKRFKTSADLIIQECKDSEACFKSLAERGQFEIIKQFLLSEEVKDIHDQILLSIIHALKPYKENYEAEYNHFFNVIKDKLRFEAIYTSEGVYWFDKKDIPTQYKDMKITEIVKDNNKATFSHAIAGVLYYKVTVGGDTYQFPVDMNDKEDVGTATFKAEDKAITLMRYINKALKNSEFIKL